MPREITRWCTNNQISVGAPYKIELYKASGINDTTSFKVREDANVPQSLRTLFFKAHHDISVKGYVLRESQTETSLDEHVDMSEESSGIETPLNEFTHDMSSELDDIVLDDSRHIADTASVRESEPNDNYLVI